MKFLCFIFFDERVLDDLSKRQYDALVDESLAYKERLRESHQLIEAQALQSAKEAVTLRVRGGHVSITDGPFAETKELVAGYWLWEVRSMDEAIEWVRRCPNPHVGDSDIEIRPIFSAEEFEALLPKSVAEQVTAQDARLRDQVAART